MKRSLTPFTSFRATRNAWAPELPDSQCPANGYDHLPTESRQGGATLINRVYLIFIATSLLASLACSSGSAKDVGPTRHPLQLKTTAAQERTVSDTLQIPAQIQADPARVVRVYPPAGGRLVRVSVRPGDYVRRGDTVAVLESSDVAQARSDFAKAQAEADRAERDLERSKQLLDHGAASERQYDDAKAQQIEASSELKRAKARLAVLGASTDGSGNEVSVRSPISGTVLDLGAAAGELSKSTDNANPICTIADLSSVWVMGDVFEKDLPDVHVGEPIRFAVTAYPNRYWDGKVSMISDAVDPTTRTVKVRIVSPNPQHELKPQMFASLEVRRPAVDALVIPAASLLHEGSDTTVMVKSGDNNYERRLVAVKPLDSDTVIVTSGLKPGETVVTEGASLLRSNGDE